jgi:hypothetical protein
MFNASVATIFSAEIRLDAVDRRSLRRLSGLRIQFSLVLFVLLAMK